MHPIAHAVWTLSGVAALGLTIGSLRLGGFHLGIAGVLFTGLVFSHFGVAVSPDILAFVREFGLILFVYAIGLQVGPGFLSAFRKQGMALNGLAVAIVTLGSLITVGLIVSGLLPGPVAIGILCGATTNTPSLAAAQQTLHDIAADPAHTVQLVGLGYAAAYPFGVLGILLTLSLLRGIFRTDPVREAAELSASARGRESTLSAMNLEITNPNVDGKRLDEIPVVRDAQVIISRLLHQGRLQLARPETRLSCGDIVLAVGAKERLEDVRVIVGRESALDLRAQSGPLVTRRILVTRASAAGKSVEELAFLARYGVTVTRVSRSGIEFTPAPNVKLQLGDAVFAVGDAEALAQVSSELGNSAKQLDEPRLIPMFLGIALGVWLGQIPLTLPGIPAPVKLGVAGGPLLVAMLLSGIGRVGPFVWYLPNSANFILREAGIVLFLACVGLMSGDRLLDTLWQHHAWWWILCGGLITVVPLLVVGLIARRAWRMNFASLCGLLAGSITDPPALAFANTMTRSEAPAISYATVYPLVMLLRVVIAQLLVLLFP